MEPVKIIFYLSGAVVLLAALLILITKNIIHSVYLLLVVLLGIAAIYILSGAEFVAASQIMIYAGGILILLIFGIMLTNRIGGYKVYTGTGNRLAGTVLGLAFFILLILAMMQARESMAFSQMPGQNPVMTTTQNLGIRLMTEFVLPFEVTGMLLLVALVGASFLARKDFGKKAS